MSKKARKHGPSSNRAHALSKLVNQVRTSQPDARHNQLLFKLTQRLNDTLRRALVLQLRNGSSQMSESAMLSIVAALDFVPPLPPEQAAMSFQFGTLHWRPHLSPFSTQILHRLGNDLMTQAHHSHTPLRHALGHFFSGAALSTQATPDRHNADSLARSHFCEAFRQDAIRKRIANQLNLHTNNDSISWRSRYSLNLFEASRTVQAVPENPRRFF